MTGVSLNDVFLIQYTSVGSLRNQCYMTAKDTIGSRTLNLDHVVFCSKLWSKIFFTLRNMTFFQNSAFLANDELMPIEEDVEEVCSQYSSLLFLHCETLLGLNRWMKTDVRPNDMVRPISTVHCYNLIFMKLLWSSNYANIAIQCTEWQHTCAASAKLGMAIIVDCS